MSNNETENKTASCGCKCGTSGAEKYTYLFGKVTDGNSTMRNLLGGKGANLAEMAKIGLPVPPGFTITTEVCTYFYDNGRQYPVVLEAQVDAALAAIEEQLGKKFGDKKDPLLFSVRSGARESMPGMMDTILNLGLNDETVLALAEKSANARFAWDCYRRFIQMYGDVVMGVQAEGEFDADPFHHILEEVKEEANVELDSDLSAEQLQVVVEKYKALIQEKKGESFPQCVKQQLWGAVGAVFNSWMNDRAIIYRQKYNIPAAWGTAVNVQTMVFGNMGETSATGVAFTRDPANGENVFYGEYLINAQGEDVVAGVRTPHKIADLATDMPSAHAELMNIRSILENHFKDMQDFEFTIEDNKMFMLQTRNGKRTGLAAVRIAYEMNQEGLMDEKTAVKKIPADSISSLLVPVFDAAAIKSATPFAAGLPAGPGAATGQLVFTAAKAEAEGVKGNKVVLCREETSPEDLRGMIASEGILTSRGGVSSHAALVARQMGKVCICGASEIVVDYAKGYISANGVVIKEGENISIDGTTGKVYAGKIATSDSEVNQVINGTLAEADSYTYKLFNTVMTWADKYRRLDVRANADSPEQARSSLALGASGIGLCRTEHMFFEGDRIDYVRQMILASDVAERQAALDKLLPMQRGDFEGIFEAMKGYPVTIRLLDPPLHEFLPHDSAARNALAEKLGVSTESLVERCKALEEQNPMLGHRGCRLGNSYPEITKMQARAIFEAVVNVSKGSEGEKIIPEVMVPLVGFAQELKIQSDLIKEQAELVMKENDFKFDYMIGTMIEIPRGALTADEVAQHAEFFSFGTNDLTQTGLGMSRDDAGSFLGTYKDLDILPKNPFASIDVGGVGQLVEIGVQKGRATNPKIKLGICGEHGGDPDSIQFFHKVGLTYVSCSAPRVPVARLAAAQAALSE
ncbi:MAG: pyruvate, phosphate dikinase [Opitutales bacterium]